MLNDKSIGLMVTFLNDLTGEIPTKSIKVKPQLDR